MKNLSWGLSNSPDLKTDGPFTEEILYPCCDWCGEEREDLTVVPDFGYKHREENGKLVPYCCPEPIKSKVCDTCRMANKEKENGKN